MFQMLFTADTQPVKFPSGRMITAEVVSKPADRAKGLMFRKTLPDNEGMLFIFEEEDFHSFWMKNMIIHLDIIWLDKEKKVVYFEEDVPPCKEDPCTSYLPMKKAKYVLEVNSGFIKKEKLKLGDQLAWN